MRPPAGAIHICYCHWPFRYAWHENELALREAPGSRGRWCAACCAASRWVLDAAARVTDYIANGELTRERIHASGVATRTNASAGGRGLA